MRKSVYILTTNQIRDMYARWCFEAFQGDRANAVELILTGKVGNFIPDMSRMTNKDVADKIGELNLAEPIGAEHGVDLVLVDMGNDRYEMVWDKENVDPERRNEVEKPKILSENKEVPEIPF